jgi:hypothetical protein
VRESESERERECERVCVRVRVRERERPSSFTFVWYNVKRDEKANKIKIFFDVFSRATSSVP